MSDLVELAMSGEEGVDAAGSALARIGVEAWQPLLAETRVGGVDRRRAATTVLARLAAVVSRELPGAQDPLPTLTLLLRDEDAEIRRQATRALLFSRPAAPRAVTLLLDLLEHPETATRREAAAALSVPLRHLAYAVVGEGLQEPEAARALWERVVPRLAVAAADPDAGVRRELVVRLGADVPADPRVTAILERLAGSDDDWDIALAAKRQLEGVDPVADPKNRPEIPAEPPRYALLTRELVFGAVRMAGSLTEPYPVSFSDSRVMPRDLIAPAGSLVQVLEGDGLLELLDGRHHAALQG